MDHANATHLIRGARLLDYRIHADSRGALAAFEPDENLPFPLARVFLISADRSDTVRGGHASSCDEYIVALGGAVLAELDNGQERTAVPVRAGGPALWVRPGVLITLRAFEPGTRLMVCASARWGDTRHFDRPQPGLIEADRPA
ncbi:MAG: FdtA/QdtA family cupin domain-containing protein [Dongiaceae bacterium]